MGLEVYVQVILPSLALLALAVDAANDFGEEASGPKGDELPWFTYEINNYLIYSLSKKPVEEPNDESADSVIAGILEKILRESGIRGVVINCRIINVFRKKISLLHSAFKKASRSGGKNIRKLIDSWKAKDYSFKIFYHELQNHSLIEENQNLRGQKRKAELDLAAEQAKRLKLEQKLEDVIRDLENRKQKKKTVQRKIQEISEKSSLKKALLI